MPEQIMRGEGRHSILDLSPLELDCMNALWPRIEASVREIQEALLPTRPRAYTTIMTILDRLAQKGIVVRRKAGKAWVYRANLSAEEARAHAIAQVVEGFFDGSPEALATHLAALGGSLPTSFRRDVVPQRVPVARTRLAASAPQGPQQETLSPGLSPERLDTSLL